MSRKKIYTIFNNLPNKNIIIFEKTLRDSKSAQKNLLAHKCQTIVENKVKFARIIKKNLKLPCNN